MTIKEIQDKLPSVIETEKIKLKLSNEICRKVFASGLKITDIEKKTGIKRYKFYKIKDGKYIFSVEEMESVLNFLNGKNIDFV